MSDKYEDGDTPFELLEPIEGDTGRETVRVTPPVAKAFICLACKKGKLDPAGLKMGGHMACPECGHKTKVTLEHLMGEERASRRQQRKQTFEEMNEEEQADYLADKSALERLVIFVRYKLGARGVVAVYLGGMVLVAGFIIAYLLLFGNYELRSVSIWTVIGVIGGAAILGVVAHFVYVAIMYKYKQMIEAQGGNRASSRRVSARRRRDSTRTRPPGDE